MVFTLLLLTGLGVFRLYFSFDWVAAEDTGELFTLKIRGGQSLNVFDAPPFGRVFWVSQCCLVVLCLLMPLFRITGALILAALTAVSITTLHLRLPIPSAGTPLEFELLIIGILVGVYLLLSYIGDQRDQKNIARLLSKFVPEELSDQYQRNPDAWTLSGEECEISVLFCDVRDFSAVTQALDSAKLAQWLNLYFTHVSKIVVRHRGSIDKYMGDSLSLIHI